MIKGELTIKQTGGSPFSGIINIESDAKFSSFGLTSQQGEKLAVRALFDSWELMCLIDPGDGNPIRFCFYGIRKGMEWKTTGQWAGTGKFTNWSAGFRMID